MPPALLIALVASATTPSALRAQETRDVTGLVLALRDSTPIGGVLVRVTAREMTVVTDAAGAFVLPGVPRVPLTLTFTRLGVQPDTARLRPEQDEIRVYLQQVPIELPPITAEVAPAARLRFDAEVQPSVVSIDRQTIALLPALMEADVLRVVQLLPGTTALNDYTVGFNVRGGEPDQNLTQLDGITVFNPSHLGGLFSTFDADAVDAVDFITGAFPAEYGGRLSSVLDVGVRPGRSDRFGVQGNVSLLATKLLVEGPVGHSGITYLLSARRTYADVLVGALSSEVLPYHFADAVGKLSAPIGRGGSLSLTGYWGEDAIDWTWIEARPGQDAVILKADWGNRLLGLRFRHPIGAHEISIDAGITTFSTRFRLEPSVFDAANTVRLLSSRATLELRPHAAHVLRMGGGVEDYRMTYHVVSESFGAEFFTAGYRPRVWSVFLDEQWRPFRWLMLRPGVRVEAVQGPDVVTVAPRVGAKAFLSRDLALTASVGRYHQAIHSLRDQNVPWNIFDFWIGADSATPVARSDHFVLGLERWFGGRVSVTLEGYRKTFRDIIDANLNEDPRVTGDETVPVDGDAWGIDLLVRKHWGGLTGWVAYSLNRTVRRSRGEEYPAVHDRRHSLNVVLQTRGPLGSDMSVRVGYGSPLPFTPFVGEWTHRVYRADANAFDDSQREPIASPTLNSARYPYYGRIDVSFRWEVRKWGGVLRPYVQLVNVLNRKNVFVYSFDYTTAPATRSAISQLPILPSVGVEFVF
ncbi:MAG: TonB-dependent receptor [Gemmatimonadales bacterium]|nr:TonB-dependent receptor [Gemmatimonadales bacterium]